MFKSIKIFINMKIVIFALTRGYPSNKSKYDSLIERNYSIYEHINSKRGNPTDMILFHEGNISIEDQEYINSKYQYKIKFRDVSQYFEKVNFDLEGEEKYGLGYRYMCRFNMYHIWKEISDYDYALRVDEDIKITKFDPFVFESMKEKNIVYMAGRFTKDIHRATNSTLPKYLMDNTNLNVKKIYNHRNPYTNLYATSVDFWKNKETNEILKKIAMTKKQIIYRWGDHTVHGIALNHKNERIHLFPKLEYSHISHNFVIKNNFLRNITINSKLNPISIKEGFYTKLKLKIKGKLKNQNPYDFEVN